MSESQTSEVSLPKNVEIFIRIATVFVASTVALAPFTKQDGDTFFDQVLHVLPWTVPIALGVVICTVLFLRWRASKTSQTDIRTEDYNELPPLN